MADQSRYGALGRWSETRREWFWCYPDQLLFELPAGPAPSHPGLVLRELDVLTERGPGSSVGLRRVCCVHLVAVFAESKQS
jgi:hypothetical protein